MYHIIFTLSTYREYCHARGLADELANEFCTIIINRGRVKDRGKKEERKRESENRSISKPVISDKKIGALHKPEAKK